MSLITDSKYIKLASSRLRNFKQKDAYLWNFSCPICGDSQKNKLKARGYVFKKGNDLFYRCHNCGAGVNLGNLLKHIDSSLHKEYSLERYKSGQSGATRSAPEAIKVPSPRFGKIAKSTGYEKAEYCDRLQSGHFCLEYLKRRLIPEQHYKSLLFTNKYRQFVIEAFPTNDKEIVDDARLIIPFYDEYNELIAVSGRALETGDKLLRYVTVRTNGSQNKLIYGLERVNKQEKVLLVEGPLDSLFLNNCLASGDANLALTARDIPIEGITLIFDNEPRNKEIVKMMQNAIKLEHTVVIWPNGIEGKDINEMILGGISPDEIQDIISSNSFNGLRAQMNFNMWKKV